MSENSRDFTKNQEIIGILRRTGSFSNVSAKTPCKNEYGKTEKGKMLSL